MKKTLQILLKINFITLVLMFVGIANAQTIGSTSINTEPQEESDLLISDTQIKYPHQSVAMTSKTFKSYEREGSNVNIAQPICILGSDALSRKWLTNNKVQLEELQTICFVAEVPSYEDFVSLQLLAPNVRMTGQDISIVSQMFNVQHYPVLITNEWITQ